MGSPMALIFQNILNLYIRIQWHPKSGWVSSLMPMTHLPVFDQRIFETKNTKLMRNVGATKMTILHHKHFPVTSWKGW